MARSIFRKRCFLLTFGSLLAVANAANAQTPVISFAGSNATSTISGYFDYWQPEPVTVGHPGLFTFTGDKTHSYGVNYTIVAAASSSNVNKQGGNQITTCTINTAVDATNMRTFGLNLAYPSVSISIVLYPTAPMTTTALPVASLFASTPAPTGTLTQTINGTATTFDIVVTTTSTIGLTAVARSEAVYYVSSACPAPAPCAPCPTRPRPASCLCRLFARRSCP
jgi:hypothetical protein